jgi:hypothetical protein
VKVAVVHSFLTSGGLPEDVVLEASLLAIHVKNAA